MSHLIQKTQNNRFDHVGERRVHNRNKLEKASSLSEDNKEFEESSDNIEIITNTFWLNV